MDNEGYKHETVSDWIFSLKQGDNEAARELWSRYFRKLCTLAANKLGTHPCRVSDEEDIAVSVFDALCTGLKQHQFKKLNDRIDLWRLLVVITSNKVTDRFRRDNAQKRGAGVTHRMIEDAISEAPSPEDLMALQETCESLFKRLNDSRLCEIARLKLEGHSNRDVANQLSISIRTVERKLDLIESIWISAAAE